MTQTKDAINETAVAEVPKLLILDYDDPELDEWPVPRKDAPISTDSDSDDVRRLATILNAIYEEYKDDLPVLAEVIWDTKRLANRVGRRVKQLEQEIERLKGEPHARLSE